MSPGQLYRLLLGSLLVRGPAVGEASRKLRFDYVAVVNLA